SCPCVRICRWKRISGITEDDVSKLNPSRSRTAVQPLRAPEGGKQPCPDSGYADRPDAADDDGGNGTEKGGHGAGAKFAKFVGCAHENAVDGTDPAPQMIGRP